MEGLPARRTCSEPTSRDARVKAKKHCSCSSLLLLLLLLLQPELVRLTGGAGQLVLSHMAHVCASELAWYLISTPLSASMASGFSSCSRSRSRHGRLMSGLLRRRDGTTMGTRSAPAES